MIDFEHLLVMSVTEIAQFDNYMGMSAYFGSVMH